MHFSTLASSLVVAMSASTALAAPSKAGNLAKRQSNFDDKAEELCNDHDFEEIDQFALVIGWSQHGTIDPGSGDPGIGNSASIATFDKENCEEIDKVGWNGGAGNPDEVKYDEISSGDLKLKIWMENPDFVKGEQKIIEPKDVESCTDDDGCSRGPKLNCAEGTSDAGFGYARYYRICSFAG